MPNTKLTLVFALALLSAAPAQAYIGPGASAGTVAVVLGVLASIFMAFIAVLWYPIKRLIRKRKPVALQVSTPFTPGGDAERS